MTETQKVALAYLLGAYLSDGDLELSGSGSFSPRWRVTDKPFMGCIKAALDLIGVRYSEKLVERGWRKTKNWKKLRYCKDILSLRTLQPEAGDLGEWFNEVSEDKDHLPHIPRKLVRPLVAGLMDGDGSISLKQPWGFCLRFTGSEGFVHDFKDLLERENVRVGKDQIKNRARTEWKTCYQWSINIEDFLAAGLNFAMPRKQDRLAQWCGKVRQPARKVAIARWWLYEVYSSLMECVSEDKSLSNGRYYVARLASRRTFQEVQQHEADHFGFQLVKGG